MPEYAVTTAENAGSATVVVSGWADLYAAPEVQRVVNDALQGKPDTFHFDLTDVAGVDAAMIGILVGAARTMELRGGQMEVRCGETVADGLGRVGLRERLCVRVVQPAT
jgi:anti-anti-sigma factor